MLDSLDTLISFALIFTLVSLLVTTVVQMIASALNLRGRNLAWGVAEAFEAIEPELAAKANGRGKELADHLLKDPLLSDRQGWGIVGAATAVRPEELFDLLFRIATGKKAITGPVGGKANDNGSSAAADAQKKIKDSVDMLFNGLGITPADLNSNRIATSANEKMAALKKAAESLPDGEVKTQLLSRLGEAISEMGQLAARIQTEESKAEAAFQANLHAAYQRFEAWMDTGQERAQDWFRWHSNAVTLSVSILFAVVLQLDAIEIFKMVSSNKAMRDKLVVQASTLVGQGEKMLGTSGQPLEQAVANWKISTTKTYGSTNDAVKNAVLDPSLKVDMENDSRDSFRRKVEAKLTPLTIPGPGTNKAPVESQVVIQLLRSLDQEVDAAAAKSLNEKSADYNRLKRDLDGTGFALFPPTGFRWNSDDWNQSRLQHIIGILSSILLLSLGAPFWFNQLKNLASLRSTIASNISAEDKTDEKHGSNPPPGTPPVTVLMPKVKTSAT